MFNISLQTISSIRLSMFDVSCKLQVLGDFLEAHLRKRLKEGKLFRVNVDFSWKIYGEKCGRRGENIEVDSTSLSKYKREFENATTMFFLLSLSF